MRRLGAFVLTALAAFAYCSDVALARHHSPAKPVFYLASATTEPVAPPVATPAPSPLITLTSLVLATPTLAPTGGLVAAPDLAPADFFAEVGATIHGLGGVPTLMKISLIITLLISGLKVSAFRRVIWAHVGAAQPWVAPFLGFLAGVTGLGAGGAPVTPALVFAYAFAGGGAVFIHEALDSLKSFPGLGAPYAAAIDVLSRMLGGTEKSGEPPIVTPPRG